jgi:hypothetical protein
MLELSPTDPIVKAYLADLKHLKDQHVTHELGWKGPFQNLLDKAAKKRGWTLVPELSTYSGGKRVVPDGTVRDEYRLAPSYSLGSRSALEWVIDQYQIKGDSDPNREEDPGYIVRLVGQAVRVSVENGADREGSAGLSVRCSLPSAPTGRPMSAQGNALGKSRFDRKP